MAEINEEVKDNNQNLAPRNFCQEASDQFIELTEENMDDPRIAISVETSKQSKKRKGGWTPTWDARDSR